MWFGATNDTNTHTTPHHTSRENDIAMQNKRTEELDVHFCYAAEKFKEKKEKEIL